MTFLLQVDGTRWHANADQVLAEFDDEATGGMLIPVAKSNGYGLGQARVAQQMRARQRPILSVGTIHEALASDLDWDADLLVLTPWNQAESAAEDAWHQVRQRYGTRLITTVADSASLRAIARDAHPERPSRVLVEGLTSVRRFGFIEPELQAELRDPVLVSALQSGAVRLCGLALHLPIAQPEIAQTSAGRHLASDPPTEPVIDGSGKVQQAAAWGLWWLEQMAQLSQQCGPEADFTAAAQLWVSHVSAQELRQLRAQLRDVAVNPRVGTALWLGDSGALQAHGVVLAVHASNPGGAGYFQRRVPSGAHLVIVGGGTNHGVAMSGPIGSATLRRRVTTVGNSLLDAAGRPISPFRWHGKRLRFLEAPHASVSLVIVPKGVPAPGIGAALPCQIRLSTAHFDHVDGLT